MLGVCDDSKEPSPGPDECTVRVHFLALPRSTCSLTLPRTPALAAPPGGSKSMATTSAPASAPSCTLAGTALFAPLSLGRPPVQGTHLKITKCHC